MSDSDFTNLDYESDEYYDEQGRKVRDSDYTECGSFQLMELNQSMKEEPSDGPGSAKENGAKEGSPEELPPHPGYTWNDMTPTERDPRCKSETKLACFWPVYVGNFRCENCQNEWDEFQRVKEYFAWKGLHVRWWFRKNDQYYNEFQKKAGIFDMLVYFVSEQDANRAIQLCHRESYKGHQMNVFPGREPVYFHPKRSAWDQNISGGLKFSETFFEQRILETARKVKVSCTVKLDTKIGAIEFRNVASAKLSKRWIKRFSLKPVPEQLRKQRFLEQDLLEEIESHLAANPKALEVDNDDRYMHMLLRAQRPQVDPKPAGEVVPLASASEIQNMMLQRKRRKQRKQILQALRAGRKPKCYDMNKFAKKRFKEMVGQARMGKL